MTIDKGTCACGSVALRMTDRPLFRMYCHCTICQRFNDANFADILVFSSASVVPPEAGSVKFETYRPPPNVQRGKCTSCNQAAIELFETPLFPKLTMVPAGMFDTGAALPPAVAHVFYDKRVQDAKDDLPKYKGYLLSQLMFGKFLLARPSRNG